MVVRSTVSSTTNRVAKPTTDSGGSGAATPSTPNPSEVLTDLQAWFSSTDNTRLTTVGGLVSNWAGLGDAGTEAIQGTIAYRPSLNTVGGKNALVFGETAAADDWLDCDNNPAPLIPASGNWMVGVAGVVSKLPTSGVSVILGQFLFNQNQRLSLGMFTTGASQLFFRDGATSRVARSTNLITDGESFYATFFRDGSTWGTRLNGEIAVTFTSSSHILQAGNIIGAVNETSGTTYNATPMSLNFSGAIYDLVVTHGYDADELTALETYLSSRI